MNDRSHRNTLRIDVVPKSEKESWDDGASWDDGESLDEAKVNELFVNKLRLEWIERTYKITKYLKDKNRPRTIIIKLLNYKDKVNVLRNLSYLKAHNHLFWPIF